MKPFNHVKRDGGTGKMDNGQCRMDNLPRSGSSAGARLCLKSLSQREVSDCLKPNGRVVPPPLPGVGMTSGCLLAFVRGLIRHFARFEPAGEVSPKFEYRSFAQSRNHIGLPRNLGG